MLSHLYICSIWLYFAVMQERHYKTILYFISIVILATLAMQVYWNYKNYQVGKQQIINEVQISLDNAVETYYATLAQENIIGVALSDEAEHIKGDVLDSIFKNIIRMDSIETNSIKEVSINIDAKDSVKGLSIFTSTGIKNTDTIYDRISISEGLEKSMAQWHRTGDTIFKNPLAKLTSRVIFGITEQELDIVAFDSLLKKELDRKRIDIAYKINYKNGLFKASIDDEPEIKKDALSTTSKSDYLPKDAEVKLQFSNVASTILKRNAVGVLFSLLFAIAIIGALLYLLKVIKTQKQLAEVKNDLISNITHEFKTPLATIGAAMEGIQVFNTTNDIEKTLKYAKMSSGQVEKLTTMVEKLLETATLDGDQLALNFESTNLSALLENISQKEAFTCTGKTISFHASEILIEHPIDRFHFENAINNIVDNAIKYGGDTIVISIAQKSHTIEILITDNGTSLTAAQSKQLFEKFYRVPKGNTHDVKGFGIGLYYTKAIVDKHGGAISISVKPTTFKITLPHG